MSFLGFMKKSLIYIIILSVIVVLFNSCSKEEKVPDYIGKWQFFKATPAANVDDCYKSTWFVISLDNTFSFYNSCKEELRNGTWVRKGIGFQAMENGKVFDEFSGELVKLTKDKMIVDTEMFGGKTRVEFVKIEEFE